MRGAAPHVSVQTTRALKLAVATCAGTELGAGVWQRLRPLSRRARKHPPLSSSESGGGTAGLFVNIQAPSPLSLRPQAATGPHGPSTVVASVERHPSVARGVPRLSAGRRAASSFRPACRQRVLLLCPGGLGRGRGGPQRLLGGAVPGHGVLEAPAEAAGGLRRAADAAAQPAARPAPASAAAAGRARAQALREKAPGGRER